MNDYNIRTNKIVHRIDSLASCSDDGHGITRTFGSRAFLEGRELVMAWMQEAGLQTRIDQVGNVRGKLNAGNQEAKTFLIASHIDTVVNAGRFDGPLGVIMGIDLLENLVLQKARLPFNLELIAFSDEEGVRFHTTFLGSRALAGSLDNDVLARKDADGVTVSEAIRAMAGDPNRLWEDIIKERSLLGYFEIHIEQGPVLYEKDIPAALVKAIAVSEGWN